MWRSTVSRHVPGVSWTHAQGDTPVKVDNVILNVWHNAFSKPHEMKKLGYKIINIPNGLVYIVPQAGYYNDYLNCQYLYELSLIHI